ncbi:unnamed protein product, partial [Polarella glacialis]
MCSLSYRQIAAQQTSTEARLRLLKAGTSQVSALGRQRQWQACLRILSDLRDDSLQPGLVSHNAVVAACTRAGPSVWPQALDLASALHIRGLLPDHLTFSSVIGALG